MNTKKFTDNFDFFIPYDIGEKISTQMDDTPSVDYFFKYEKAMNILYPDKNLSVTKIVSKIYKEFKDDKEFSSNYSRLEKKNFLINLLIKKREKGEYDNQFLSKLKKFIPTGIHGKYIITDTEYENLKKEFNIKD